MTSYSLGIEELDSIIGEIREGSNLMVIGPPMSGKEDVAYHILKNGLKRQESSVIVSTREPGEHVLEWFTSFDKTLPVSNIGIVDCVTKTLGMAADDTDNIKRASSPVDLTGIGVRISQFFEQFWMKRQISHNILCINSVSTILMYSNIQTVFRFMHVFTGRIKAIKGLGLFVVEDQMHDSRTIATLKQLYDGMIEVQEENGSHYLRAVGISSKPTPWFEYLVEDGSISIQGIKED